MGCKVGGYCSDMTRTVALGEPSAEMRKVYNTVLEAQRLGREALAPGKSCYEIDKLVRDYIDSQGYVGRFGHGPVSYTHLDVYKRQVSSWERTWRVPVKGHWNAFRNFGKTCP